MHNTRAGVIWVYDPVFFVTKIAIGIEAVSREGIGHTGIFSDRHAIDRKVCEIILPFPDRYAQFSTHKEPRAEVLARRARFCRPWDRGGKDELSRFRDSVSMRPFYDMVEKHWWSGLTIDLDDILEVQERHFELEYNGMPGVYVLQDTHSLDRIYVGKGGSMVKRARSHGELWRVVRCYATATVGVAEALENHIHKELIQWPHVWRRDNQRGMYLFKNDRDGVIEVDQLVRERYSNFVLNKTAKIITIGAAG